MQSLTDDESFPSIEVEEVIALFGGDVRKALTVVLRDCHHLHEQLFVTSKAMSTGFTRGWIPVERIAADS